MANGPHAEASESHRCVRAFTQVQLMLTQGTPAATHSQHLAFLTVEELETGEVASKVQCYLPLFSLVSL